MPDPTLIAQTDDLIRTVLASEDPWTLDLAPGLDHEAAMALLVDRATDDAWRAYDLIHQLKVFGRAF